MLLCMHASLAAATGPAAKADPSKAAEPELVYRGCYTDENMFGKGRIYAGATTGAHISLAKHHAIANNKPYLAMARAGSDGHAFAFDGPLQE